MTDPTTAAVLPVLTKMCEERYETEEALEQEHRGLEREEQEEFLVTRTVGSTEVQQELELWRPAIEKVFDPRDSSGEADYSRRVEKTVRGKRTGSGDPSTEDGLHEEGRNRSSKSPSCLLWELSNVNGRRIYICRRRG